MHKIIPVSVKVTGMFLVIVSAFFPLLVINVTFSWNVPSPPNAQPYLRANILKYTIFTIDFTNVSYDKETNQFKIDSMEEVDNFYHVFAVLTTFLWVIGIVCSGIGSLLTYLRGKTTSGGILTFISGLIFLFLAMWVFTIQFFLLHAFTDNNDTTIISGNTVTRTSPIQVNGEIYELITESTIALGLGSYLLLLAAIIIITSIFLRSDELSPLTEKEG